MPEGSSSEAPVITPGPSSLKNRFSGFLSRFSPALGIEGVPLIYYLWIENARLSPPVPQDSQVKNSDRCNESSKFPEGSADYWPNGTSTISPTDFAYREKEVIMCVCCDPLMLDNAGKQTVLS